MIPRVGDALQDAERPDLRQRRLRRDPRQGAGERRLEARSRRGARPRSARASCAASASAASWKSRAASSRRPSACASRRTARSRCAPACRRWGRGICRRSRRWSPSGSASTRALVRLVQGDSDEVPRRHAERRLALDHDGRQRHGACLRRSDREGQGRARRICSRPPPSDVEFSDGMFRVRGTDRAMPILELAERMRTRRAAGGAGGRARQRRQVHLAADELPQRLPHLRGRDRPRYRRRQRGRLCRGRRCRHDAATRPSSRARSTAAWRRAWARCSASSVVYGDDGQLAHRLVHGLRHAARATICRRCRCTITWCRARPIRSASKAPANRASPARCRPASARCSMRWRRAASPHLDLPMTSARIWAALHEKQAAGGS